MDYQYNRNIGNFNSLCLKERIFFTAGTIDGDTPNSEMGSLIWNLKGLGNNSINSQESNSKITYYSRY